jgi:hypothetical protein
MNRHLFIFTLVLSILSVSSDADVALSNRTVMHFASPSEGKKLLTAKDDFIRHLSPFDRSARMKLDRPVSEDEFLTFVEENVSAWTKEEMQAIQGAVQKIEPRLHDLALSFPSTVQLIKTTGAEEGNAAYTRGTAIVIPKVELSKTQAELEKIICHELFHILSRHNPELRERLYAIIGFIPCDEIEFPRELASRRITNPDAPRNDHFIRLSIAGQQCLAVPILFSNAEVYDVQKGGEFFEYLNFQFLVMNKSANPGHLKTIYENGKPKLIGPQEVSGFFEQVGRNTKYVIHPEEILADNFALLILGKHDVPSSEIPRKMEEILFRKTTA